MLHPGTSLLSSGHTAEPQVRIADENGRSPLECLAQDLELYRRLCASAANALCKEKRGGKATPQAASLILFDPVKASTEVLGLVHSAAPLIPTSPSLALLAGHAEAMQGIARNCKGVSAIPPSVSSSEAQVSMCMT